MKLITLTLDHFKGIQHFEMQLDGCDATVYGDNATGKTTLYDAFLWLLFGKDSTDRKDFEIQPLGADGKNAQSGVETSVSAVLEKEDGSTVTLRRAYAEKWEKRRGSAVSELTGHTSAFYVDELPVKQNEYRAYVEGLMPERTFKALTGTEYFCAVLPWQERRKVLLELTGGVVEDEIFAADPALDELRVAKGTHTVEDYKLICSRNRAAFNKELSALPARIDEASRGIRQDVSDPDELEKQFRVLQEERCALTDTLARNQDAAEAQLQAQIAEKRAAIRQLEAESSLRRDQQKEVQRCRIRENNEPVRARLNQLNEEAAQLRLENTTQGARAKRFAERAEELRGQYRSLRAEEWSGELACPSCRRPYAPEDISKARAAYNAHKRERLDAINAEGGRVAQEEREARQAQEIKAAALEEVLSQINAAKSELLSEEFPEPEEDPEMLRKRARLLEEIGERETKLRALRADRADFEDGVRVQIAQRDKQIHNIQMEIAAAGDTRRALARIAELQERQRAVADELERAERLLTLCDRYTRSMVALIEARVDGKFRLVRWKLFDEQINGGIADTCVPTVDGVPYADLNHAMRVNAGLDVVQTLGEFYGMTAPVFVDNAESVTELAAITAQTIRLVVSASDKQLRVTRE